jgi:fluoride ion exporter CrcB/FEX
VLWPPGVWLLGVAAVVVGTLKTRHLEVNRAVQVVVGLGLLGLLAMLSAWSGDGQETTRHTLEGLAEVRLGVLIMLLYVLLARVPTRKKASDPQPTADLIAT